VNPGWKGYLVVQAKCREGLEGGASDVAWLTSQLGNELKKFKSAPASARLPEYYIIATNVHLSGADGHAGGKTLRTGGFSKICAELENWKSDHAIKDFDVWPADKIIDLLANAESIRRTYAAWITPGDVLSAMLDPVAG
jgi:hypothetical protein